jgi:hypothetical protein
MTTHVLPALGEKLCQCDGVIAALVDASRVDMSFGELPHEQPAGE